jgi:hypothetical protein
MLVSSCVRVSAATELRPEYLRRVLLEHDRAALARDPALVAGKYERMARSTFAFFRGTAWLIPREPSRFEAAPVAVIGDPHPENVGTFVTGAGLRVVDFNDFDLAGYGSYVEDLRRLAVGLWIVADMGDLGHKQRLRVVNELVDGYLAEVRGLGRGEKPVALREDSFTGELEDILVRADEPTDGSKEAAAAPEERKLAEALLAAYPKTLLHPERFRPAMFAVKRITRQNAGVASFPVLRLRALVEGPGPSEGDDWLLELKESGGQPAALLVALQRQLQEFPDDDPLLGWSASGGREFRVRRLSPAQRRLDAERIAKQVKSPRWGKRDFKDFGADLGRLLARGHCRARARDGRPGLAALGAAIGDGQGLRQETAAFAERIAQTADADRKLFRKLLEERGPLLGWRKD